MKPKKPDSIKRLKELLSKPKRPDIQSFIKKIRIKNFKNLEDVEIEIKPLTFLFGPNGSGKSSFMKAMMFLSKNIHPLNTGKTIYKIDDELDLGSFKDIVSNGDTSKEIIFEFDIEGEYQFPNKEGFQEFLNDNIVLNFFSYFINIIEKENKYTYGDRTTKSFSKEFCKFKYIITFSQNSTFLNGHIKNINFKSIRIIDELTKSNYNFEINNSIIRSGQNTGMNEEALFDEEYFLFPAYSELENVLNSILGQDKKTGSEELVEKYENIQQGNSNLFGNLVFNTKIQRDLIIYFKVKAELVEKESVGLNEEQKTEAVNYYNKEADNVERYLNSLSTDEKNNMYYHIIKLCYLSWHHIPVLLSFFLQIKHIPTTRKAPKPIYILEENEFNKSEYYGFLNYLYKDIVEKDIYKNIEKKVIDMDQIKFSDIVKLHIISRHTLKKIEDRKIIYSKFIEINYKLISNFNIHLIYCIKKDNKTGEIFLKNKENNKIPFSNSSSGFIQLFPVIVLCSFFKGFITKDLEIFFPYFPKSTYHTSVFFENLDTDVYFSTLLTEQPELHLHPKLQSELAILFADTINKTSGYGNMIIETHSEHLIRKIQVLIARGELDRSKLSVQYFNNENGITKVETMEIDEHGLFVKDWPNGFFDDSVNLTMELYEAIREIKKRKN